MGAVLSHMKTLTPEGKVKAAEYIWRAPEFVKTPVRTALQKEPWFLKQKALEFLSSKRHAFFGAVRDCRRSVSTAVALPNGRREPVPSEQALCHKGSSVQIKPPATTKYSPPVSYKYPATIRIDKNESRGPVGHERDRGTAAV